MQGRLSDLVGGKIQAFPVEDWRQEFSSASSIGIHRMEWTLDQDGLHENPLMSCSGREQIKVLSKSNKIEIKSLTGDCFMQAPFWKSSGKAKDNLLDDFYAVCRASSAIGIKVVVMPLVDNGSLDKQIQEDDLVATLLATENFLTKHSVCIAFESDYEPEELRRFIDRLPAKRFGVNYDIGNSAALGFDPKVELDAYGHRVLNVHVKDRMLGGATVPLGDGAAEFDVVFSELSNLRFQGSYILQTARASDGKHAQALAKYMQMTSHWIIKHSVQSS